MEFDGERLVPGKTDDDLWAEHFSRYIFAQPLVKGLRVLDLGTGAGYGAAHLSLTAKTTAAIDISPEAIEYAKTHFPGNKVEHVVGDVRATPFPDASFDAVVCFEVIEHVEDPERIVAEAKRLLTPKGLFIVSTPNRSYYTDERGEQNHFHHHEFDPDEFEALLKKYFGTVKLYVQNHASAVVVSPTSDTTEVPALLGRRVVEKQNEALNTSHYVVAICGEREVVAPAVVYLPHQEGNVLRERERHIRFLKSEVDELHSRDTWAMGVGDELKRTQENFNALSEQLNERTTWAAKLSHELEVAADQVTRLNAELKNATDEIGSRTAWALKLEAELKRSTDELESRTAWALKLDAELKSREETLSDRTAWARRLDNELNKTQHDFQRSQATLARTEQSLAEVSNKVEALTDQVEEASAHNADLTARALELNDRAAELEVALAESTQATERWMNDFHNVNGEYAALLRSRPVRLGRAARQVANTAKNAARLSKGLALQGAAAALSVPLAGMVGTMGLAAEAFGRLLPGPQRPAPLKAVDPTAATLLILNFNGRDLLAKNLPHCLKAIGGPESRHEIVVCDNGSDDGSVELVREQFPSVKLVTLDRNRFFSAGNNFALPHTSKDIIVLLNNDMRVEPDFLEPLLAPFDGRDDVFAVASQILMDATKRREETGLTRGYFHNGELKFRHEAKVPTDEKAIPILWAGGGAAAFDRRKLMELGGLDTMFDPFYCEDLDLSLRAWSRGWQVLFAPQSKVWHDHRTTSRRVFGEHYVNEIFRRNTLLLHWANLREPQMFAEHLAALPMISARFAREHGVSGVRSLLRAAVKAPQALARRAFVRSPGPALSTVLEKTEAGVSPMPKPRARKTLAANEPLRIVMVAPYHLYPVEHGGAVFMYEALKELARRGNDVSLLGFVDTDEQLDAASHLKSFCSNVELLRRGAPGPSSLLAPLPVREFDQQTMRTALLKHIDRHDPDVLQIEYTHMAQYGRPSNRYITSIAEHDIASLSLRRQLELAKDPATRRALRVEYLKMFHYELNALRAFDLVLTMTDREAGVLKQFLGPTANVVGRARAGIDVAKWSSITRRPDAQPTALYVGNFNHPPNVDGVLFFCREILPRIRESIPHFRVVIAGGNPPLQIKALAETDPFIEVKGFVEDLRPLYERATLFIAPIRVAAGVRVKLLETFAAGLPVVATSLGAEGLTVTSERELIIADAVEDFAAQVVRVTRDRALADALGSAAQQFVTREFQWPSVIASLENEYRQALKRRALHLEH